MSAGLFEAGEARKKTITVLITDKTLRKAEVI